MKAAFGIEESEILPPVPDNEGPGDRAGGVNIFDRIWPKGFPAKEGLGGQKFIRNAKL